MCGIAKILIGIVVLFGVACSSGGGGDAAERSTGEVTVNPVSEGDGQDAVFRCVQAGMPDAVQVILTDSFTQNGQCGFDSRWEEIIGSVSARAGGCSLEYAIFVGQADEFTAASVQLNSGRLRELTGSGFHRSFRLRWTEYFEADYDFPLGQKLARFFNETDSAVELTVNLLENNGRVELSLFLTNDQQLVEYAANVLHGIPLEQEVQFEVEARLPGPDGPGFATLSVNGETVRIDTDEQVAPLVNSCVRTWSGLWVGGNYTNGGAPVTRDSSRFIDNVEVSAALF